MYVDGGALKKSFFKQGDIIFKEGDAGDAAYIVETGSIGIFKTVDDTDLQLATIRVGELFGEMAIIDGSKRMAHAVALEESVIVVLVNLVLVSPAAERVVVAAIPVSLPAVVKLTTKNYCPRHNGLSAELVEQLIGGYQLDLLSRR